MTTTLAPEAMVEARGSAAVAAELTANADKRASLTQEQDALTARLADARRRRGAAVAGGQEVDALATKQVRALEDQRDATESALEQLADARGALVLEHAVAVRRERDAAANAAVAVAVSSIEALEAAVQAFIREPFALLDAAMREKLNAARHAENEARRAAVAVDGPTLSSYTPQPAAENAWLSRRELVPLLNMLRHYGTTLTEDRS